MVDAVAVRPGERRLPVIGFLVLVVVWLAIVKIVGQVTSDRADVVDGRLLETDQLVWAFIVPLGAAFVFVYGAVTVLGWWRHVFHDTAPVRPWVWVIPIVFAVAIALGINYSGLADRGAGFAIVLVLSALLVGFGEEGLFRVVGVVSLRQHGFTEGKVALWSSVIFGLAHVANIIGGDARALGQAVIVSFAGYFFYLIRRVSRSNILNSVLHAGFDFTILSSTQIIPEGTDAHVIGAAVAILVYVVCGIIVLVGRHRIEPAPVG